MIGKLERIFDDKIRDLPENERAFFRKIKNNFFFAYNGFLKPILIGIFMIWFFTKLKNVFGIEEASYVIGIVALIFLRSINSKLA